MDRKELYLKTAFCCMACDGEIATEEIDVIKAVPSFSDLSIVGLFNDYALQLKKEGVMFIRQYLDDVKNANLSEEEECQLVRIAIETIEADQNIEYKEIAFFKKIRKHLHASDEVLLAIIPKNDAVADQITPEEYLLPDIYEQDDISLWNNINIHFDIKSMMDNG